MFVFSGSVSVSALQNKALGGGGAPMVNDKSSPTWDGRAAPPKRLASEAVSKRGGKLNGGQKRTSY